MNINSKLLCKKQLAEDIDEYGIDFIVGKTYYMSSIAIRGFYITAENGSDIWFENESDVLEYFDIIS